MSAEVEAEADAEAEVEAGNGYGDGYGYVDDDDEEEEDVLLRYAYLDDGAGPVAGAVAGAGVLPLLLMFWF
jgi:hypothetical protein